MILSLKSKIITTNFKNQKRKIFNNSKRKKRQFSLCLIIKKRTNQYHFLWFPLPTFESSPTHLLERTLFRIYAMICRELIPLIRSRSASEIGFIITLDLPLRPIIYDARRPTGAFNLRNSRRFSIGCSLWTRRYVARKFQW